MQYEVVQIMKMLCSGDKMKLLITYGLWLTHRCIWTHVLSDPQNLLPTLPPWHLLVSMSEKEEFYEEPNSLPYIITPAFISSFVITVLCSVVFSPLLWPLITPKYHTINERKSYFNTMLSSTIHAVTVSSLTSYILSSGSLGTNRSFSKSPLGFATMQISLGYFVADLIICLMDPFLRRDMGSMTHHVAGIVAISLGLFYQGKFMFFIIYRLISELSTPFVNLWSTFRTLDEKNTIWYAFSSIGMVTTFCVCRIMPMPWHWYVLWFTIIDPASFIVPLHFRVLTVINFLAFDVLNVYWFSKMVRGAVKLFRKRDKGSD